MTLQEQNQIHLSTQEFSNLMEQYSLVEEHCYAIDSNNEIHYVNALDPTQLILYALAREYPYYGTVSIESGGPLDDAVQELSAYGVFLDAAVVSSDYNFESRIVILPFECLGEDHRNFEGFKSALLTYYETMCEGSVPKEQLVTKRPKYVYFNGMDDYLVYREVHKLFQSQSSWDRVSVVFIDVVAYQLNRESILQENLLKSVDFYLKDVNPNEVYRVTKDDPLVKDWYVSNSETAITRFYRLVDLYKQLVEMPQTHFLFMSTDAVNTVVFAAFAAAFVTHNKKLLVHVASQSWAYEHYVLQFSEFDFGTIEQRLTRLGYLGSLATADRTNTLRVCMSESGFPSLCLLKDPYINLTFKVVDLQRLVSLIGKKDDGYIYRVDADDFDSCGRVYTEEDFDFGATDEQGNLLYSLQPVTKALGIPSIEDGSKGKESKYVEYLYKVLRLVDQYVCTYDHFTTLRDAIVIQGPDTMYIGVGKLETEFRGDLLSLGLGDSYIIEDIELSTQMYDVRLISDWKREYLERLKQAYVNQYRGTQFKGFNLSYGTLPALSREEAYMCLYWACGNEAEDLTRKVDVDWFDLMMAGTYNYRVHKYLYPEMFEYMRVIKPYGFRDFPASESPLNVFGGFNYIWNTVKQAYYVKVFQEAFKTFPGSVRRLEDGSGVSD